ncbi:MAG: 2-amino-4-hydroxy-6-hydroxymethyldihydropteridine diphosphokinase [Planctomycetota bacterium]
MSVVYVGLGSNLGDRAGFLRRALQDLRQVQGLQLIACSGFRRTDPVGGPEQPDYVNAVVRAESSRRPEALLQELLHIEGRHGRHRQVPNGPRTLDLDLLLYGQHRSQTQSLELPHPRLEQRRFVLEPLAELSPRLTLADGRTPAECLASLA